MHVPTTDLRLMLTIHPYHLPAHATVHLRWSVQRWSCTHGLCIYWCARFTDTCRCCHGAGKDSLKMQSAAKRSHHAEKVSSGVPQCAHMEIGSAWTPLSHVIVCVRCSHHVPPREPDSLYGMRSMEEEAQQRQQAVLAMRGSTT